jgi:histidine ammonia-lyase
MIVLKLLGLGRGHSGVRREVIDALQACSTPTPCRSSRAQGSVGASGDLAPLAHLDRRADGRGPHRPRRRRSCPPARRSRSSGMEPLVLGPKEGLALINGTQASTAIALDALFAGERVFAAAMVAGALSVDALKGSASRSTRASTRRAASPARSRRRGMRGLLDGSEISPATHAATGCRTPTASAASRR